MHNKYIQPERYLHKYLQNMLSSYDLNLSPCTKNNHLATANGFIPVKFDNKWFKITLFLLTDKTSIKRKVKKKKKVIHLLKTNLLSNYY